MVMKYCFIVNPNAGGGKGLKSWNRAKAYMSKRGEDYEIFFTATTGDAAYIAKTLTSEITDEELTIMVIGGDGTLNEVLNGIRSLSQVRVGYIPAGTGDDFARSLKLSKNPGRAIRGFSAHSDQARVEAFDYGVITCQNGEVVRRFANSSGIGFDASICARINKSRMERGTELGLIRKLCFVREGIRELFFCKPSKGYIVLDGERRIEFNNLMFVSIHIHPYEGGGFRFGHYADPKDGMLEICAVNCKKRLRMVPALLKSRVHGLKNSKGVKTFQCTEAQIHFDKPSAVHTDGELIAVQTDIHFRCIRQQFNILR